MNELQIRMTIDPTVSDEVKYYIKNKARFDVTQSKLNAIIEGEISRDACRRGLCRLVGLDVVGMNMSDRRFLDGYKYWSGSYGYIIVVRDWHGDTLVDAVDQFEEERDNGDDEFWEARLELARHWMRCILKLNAAYRIAARNFE